ncbi:patellin-3-like [Quercus robur]|uniref:patellin-3-like n=1 Tax=Quercus robur TaxID=38942 RepID=UPI00216334C8|nr:patellin-3-like [Quercus robur]
MADETPNPPPQAVAPPPSDGHLSLAAAVAADKEEESQPPPPEPESAPAPAPAAVVTVTVTESESTAKEEEEGSLSQPPPTKEELLPPPPPAAVEVKSTSTQEQEVVSAAAVAVAVPAVESEKPTKQISHSVVSFKEESNLLSDLSDSERKALQDLRQLVQEALDTKQFTQKQEGQVEENKAEEQEGEISIWGIPLLKDDRSDVILLKFLRARDFKVKDSLLMIKNTIKWRKQFGIDALVNEDLGDEWDKVVFMHGFDREGHPVCYNVYGEFQNKELYAKAFADEEKRDNFLKWRVQFLEKGIRKLDFYPPGVSTLFQVNDLKNSPGPGKRELRLATKQALQLLQDNYPEFVAKQVFINVPWWYLAFYAIINPFLTQRTKSKFVFAGPSKSAETLFKYISPEQVPVQYGGLSVDYCDCNPDFSVSDPATEITVKPATKQTVEIIIYEKCILTWELRVVGWEVSYGAEFVPNAEGAYTVNIQKATKKAPSDEPVVSHTYKVDELGKILLTVDNPTSKKKKLIYRFKIKSFLD